MPDAPTTWHTGDPQPGRDVDKVTTPAGAVYERWLLSGGSEHDDVWARSDAELDEDTEWGLAWGDLLAIGPLADATGREPADD